MDEPYRPLRRALSADAVSWCGTEPEWPLFGPSGSDEHGIVLPLTPSMMIGPVPGYLSHPGLTLGRRQGRREARDLRQGQPNRSKVIYRIVRAPRTRLGRFAMTDQPSMPRVAATGQALERVLREFAAASSLEKARAAAAPLLTTTGAAAAARSEFFEAGLQRLVHVIVGDGPDRVPTLALAWRVTSVTAMRQHRRALVHVLSRGLPPFEVLPTTMADPEDRRHFGEAMRSVQDEWRCRYLAAAIVHERDGERARLALSTAYVEAMPVHAQQLAMLQEAFREVRFDQADPAIGRARRLASVLDGLALASWQAEVDETPGGDFGNALSELVAWAVLRSPIEDRSVAAASARSTLSYLVTIVRLHGTLAAVAGTYAVLNPLRRLFAPAGWPDDLRHLVTRAAAQLGEQLVFLVLLGMPDAELRRTFVLLLGEVEAGMRLRKLADETPSLTPEGAHWLRTGSFRKTLSTQSAVEETAVAVIDRDLGLALREADGVTAALDAIGAELAMAADFVSPQVGEDARGLLSRVDRLASHVATAARKRGIVLRGELGQVVPFVPTDHDPAPDAIGERSVRLSSRVVERISEGRPVGVVVKADVERP